MNLWAFRFLLWYICVMLVQPQNRFTVLWPLHIANVSFIVAAVLHILACLRDKRPILRLGPATGLGLVLMFFVLLANYGSPYQSSPNWNPMVDIIFKNILLMMGIEAMCTSVRRVWTVQMTCLVCTLWWIKAGLRLSAAGATYSGDRLMGAAVSMLENPNGFAYSMCIVLPLYLYAFVHTKTPWLKWAFLAGLLSGVFVVFQTGSRTGLVTLIALAVITVPHFKQLKLRNVAFAAVAITLIFPMTGKQNLERFKTIPESVGSFLGLTQKAEGPRNQDQQSADERAEKNRDTWKLIKAHPLFGVGFTPEDRVYENFPMARGQVHCEILMAGRQMGFIGMGLYVGFLGMVFLKGRRIQKRCVSDPEVADLGWVFMLQAVVFAVGGSFCPGAWHVLMMMLAGASAALDRLTAEAQERRRFFAPIQANAATFGD